MLSLYFAGYSIAPSFYSWADGLVAVHDMNRLDFEWSSLNDSQENIMALIIQRLTYSMLQAMNFTQNLLYQQGFTADFFFSTQP